MSNIKYQLFAVKDARMAAYLYCKGCYLADYINDTYYFAVEPLLKKTIEDYYNKEFNDERE